MRRQTSKPVDRSSTPRSPAGIETSRMQRSGRCSKTRRERRRAVGRRRWRESPARAADRTAAPRSPRRRRRRESAGRWLAVRCSPRADHGRTADPEADRPGVLGRRRGRRFAIARIKARSVKHASVGECSAESRRDALLGRRPGWTPGREASGCDSRRGERRCARPHVRPGNVGADARVPRVDGPAAPAFPSEPSDDQLSCDVRTEIVEFAMPM